MRLSVLVDNNTFIDRYFYGEPGVSYLLQEGDCKILFDVGYSDIFIRNAYKMGLNLRDINYLVLSHGHLDHTWGLPFLIQYFTEAKIEELECLKPTLVAHPRTFLTKSSGCLEEIGSFLSADKLSKHFIMELSQSPVWLTENLVFLGEIERTNEQEGNIPMGKVLTDEGEELDYISEDSALAYKTKEGLVIITGCSHAGICNIVEYARKVCQEERILDIIGGFHLLNPPQQQLEYTVNYLKEICPERVHACHCTDLNSKIALAKAVNLQEVGVGLQLEY